MGAVYRARDAKLNREVALKVLLPDVAGDPERLARPTPNGFDYDITPDGQRILLNVVDDRQPQDPITVVVNWPALLNRQ